LLFILLDSVLKWSDYSNRKKYEKKNIKFNWKEEEISLIDDLKYWY